MELLEIATKESKLVCLSITKDLLLYSMGFSGYRRQKRQEVSDMELDCQDISLI